MTKESRGAIITPKKGFFSFCTSFPRQMKNQYFARIRACPYHFPERKVITLSKVFAGYRGCAPGPQKMISIKVKKMKQFIAFVLVIVLCLSLSVCAFADVDSNQGGNNGGSTTAPQTGSTAIIALAVGACAAGGISFAAYKKSGK